MDRSQLTHSLTLWDILGPKIDPNTWGNGCRRVVSLTRIWTRNFHSPSHIFLRLIVLIVIYWSWMLVESKENCTVDWEREPSKWLLQWVSAVVLIPSRTRAASCDCTNTLASNYILSRLPEHTELHVLTLLKASPARHPCFCLSSL